MGGLVFVRSRPFSVNYPLVCYQFSPLSRLFFSNFSPSSLIYFTGPPPFFLVLPFTICNFHQQTLLHFAIRRCCCCRSCYSRLVYFRVQSGTGYGGKCPVAALRSLRRRPERQSHPRLANQQMQRLRIRHYDELRRSSRGYSVPQRLHAGQPRPPSVVQNGWIFHRTHQQSLTKRNKKQEKKKQKARQNKQTHLTKQNSF